MVTYPVLFHEPSGVDCSNRGLPCVLFLVLRIKLELNRCRMIPLLSKITEVLSHRNKLLNRNSKNFQLPLACRNSNLIKTTNLSRYSLNRIYLTPIKILIKINK